MQFYVHHHSRKRYKKALLTSFSFHLFPIITIQSTASSLTSIHSKPRLSQIPHLSIPKQTPSKMVAIAPLFSLVALAISATATTMSNYSSKGCPGEGQVIHDPDHGGRCTQLDPNQAQSFKTTAVDPGCTGKFYLPFVLS